MSSVGLSYIENEIERLENRENELTNQLGDIQVELEEIGYMLDELYAEQQKYWDKEKKQELREYWSGV